MNNMDEKVFESQPFGKAALKKVKNITENFRLFQAGWIGDEKWTPKIGQSLKCILSLNFTLLQAVLLIQNRPDLASCPNSDAFVLHYKNQCIF